MQRGGQPFAKSNNVYLSLSRILLLNTSVDTCICSAAGFRRLGEQSPKNAHNLHVSLAERQGGFNANLSSNTSPNR